WVVADWLAFGDHKYGDGVYATASRLFGKSARTWEDYAYIARNVRFSERSEVLPVLVHKPVAAMIPTCSAACSESPSSTVSARPSSKRSSISTSPANL